MFLLNLATLDMNMTENMRFYIRVANSIWRKGSEINMGIQYIYLYVYIYIYMYIYMYIVIIMFIIIYHYFHYIIYILN
jgi:hypothetical protein